MRARPLALPAFEVAVRRGRHALTRARGLAVHPDAHRTPRLAPLEAGLTEDLVQAFGLGGSLDEARAGNDPRRHHGAPALHRSEERRVGKEWRCGAWPEPRKN